MEGQSGFGPSFQSARASPSQPWWAGLVHGARCCHFGVEGSSWLQLPPLQISHATHIGHQLGFSQTSRPTLPKGLFLNRQILDGLNVPPTRSFLFPRTCHLIKSSYLKLVVGFCFCFFLLVLAFFLHFSWILTALLPLWHLPRIHQPLVSPPHSFPVVY